MAWVLLEKAARFAHDHIVQALLGQGRDELGFLRGLGASVLLAGGDAREGEDGDDEECQYRHGMLLRGRRVARNGRRLSAPAAPPFNYLRS
jgi:hypothetical protein